MSSDAAHTAMTDTNGDIATVTTPASLPDAQAAIPGLPDHLVIEKILRSEYFDDPAYLARLPAVSRAMRDAVAATGLEFEELDEKKPYRSDVLARWSAWNGEVTCRVKHTLLRQRRWVDITKS